MKGKVIEDPIIEDLPNEETTAPTNEDISVEPLALTESLQNEEAIQKIMEGQKKVTFKEEEYPRPKKSLEDSLGTDIVLNNLPSEVAEPKPGYVLVNQIYDEPIEDFDIAYKDDLLQVKDKCLNEPC